MAGDATYKRLINTTRWRHLRRAQLTRHPLCERCAASGLVVPAVEVHHIVPCEQARSSEEMERMMYDPGNLRSLCHACHIAVHTEMGRRSKARNKELMGIRIQEVMHKYFGDDGGAVRCGEEGQG